MNNHRLFAGRRPSDLTVADIFGNLLGTLLYNRFGNSAFRYMYSYMTVNSTRCHVCILLPFLMDYENFVRAFVTHFETVTLGQVHDQLNRPMFQLLLFQRVRQGGRAVFRTPAVFTTNLQRSQQFLANLRRVFQYRYRFANVQQAVRDLSRAQSSQTENDYLEIFQNVRQNDMHYHWLLKVWFVDVSHFDIQNQQQLDHWENVLQQFVGTVWNDYFAAPFNPIV